MQRHDAHGGASVLLCAVRRRSIPLNVQRAHLKLSVCTLVGLMFDPLDYGSSGATFTSTSDGGVLSTAVVGLWRQGDGAIIIRIGIIYLFHFQIFIYPKSNSFGE